MHNFTGADHFLATLFSPTSWSPQNGFLASTLTLKSYPSIICRCSVTSAVSSLRESPPALAVALEPFRDSTSSILHSSPNWTCSHKGLQKGSDHGSLARDVYFLFPGIFNFGGFLSSSYIEGISLFFWVFFLFGFWLLFCVLEDILGMSGLL